MGRVAAVLPWVMACCVFVSAAVLTGRALQPVYVNGGSMSPALQAGDLVLVRRHAAVGLRDIVLVREPGRSPVLHRIVGTTTDRQWVTRGDANPIADLAPVRPASVEGAVIGVVPVGTVIARWRAALGGATLANQSDSTR